MNPQATFEALLAPHQERQIAFTDFDMTLFATDTHQAGVQQFGSMIPGTNKRLWEHIDAQFARGDSDIKMGDLIELALQESIAGAGSLDEFVEWLTQRHSLVPGTRELTSFLAARGILLVGATNGVTQIASRLLEHHQLAMPFIGNSLNLSGPVPTLDCFHDREEGVRKGQLVVEATGLGRQVVLCCGDSRGDVELARETALRGALVLARKGLGLAKFCSGNVPQEQWLEYDDFRDTLAWLDARLP